MPSSNPLSESTFYTWIQNGKIIRHGNLPGYFLYGATRLRIGLAEDEVAVRKPKILELFDKPPSDSTFSNWVNAGKIVRASDFTGYYLLNATRKALGFAPEPIPEPAEAIPENQRQPAPVTLEEKERLLVALSLAIPELDEIYPAEMFPEEIPGQELIEIERIYLHIRGHVAGMSTLMEKLRCAKGSLDAEWWTRTYPGLLGEKEDEELPGRPARVVTP